MLSVRPLLLLDEGEAKSRDLFAILWLLLSSDGLEL